MTIGLLSGAAFAGLLLIVSNWDAITFKQSLVKVVGSVIFLTCAGGLIGNFVS